MSSVERKLAKNIVNYLSEDEIEAAEIEDPGRRIKYNALKRHVSSGLEELPTEIAIRILLKYILKDKYTEALRLQGQTDIDMLFDGVEFRIQKKIDNLPDTSVISLRARQAKPFIERMKSETKLLQSDLE